MTKKILVAKDSLTLAINPINSIYEQMATSFANIKILERDSVTSLLIEDITRQQKFLHATLGPVADLQASRLLKNMMPSSSVLEGIKALKDYEARFCIPNIAISKTS
ncbi:hypothetical protein [Methylobacter svalbardensis]|uniref:hypothetical protein n=1 Tax=Methylobacter svalbardensis TaxID=3080016 RepID=UPI0030ED296A